MATIKNLIIRIGVEEKTATGIRKVTTELRETSREAENADKKSGRLSGTLTKLGRISGSGLARLGTAAIAAGKGIAILGAAAAGANTVVQLGVGLAPLAGLLAAIRGGGCLHGGHVRGAGRCEEVRPVTEGPVAGGPRRRD
jgi:hypothetical protein